MLDILGIANTIKEFTNFADVIRKWKQGKKISENALLELEELARQFDIENELKIKGLENQTIKIQSEVNKLNHEIEKLRNDNLCKVNNGLGIRLNDIKLIGSTNNMGNIIVLNKPFNQNQDTLPITKEQFNLIIESLPKLKENI